MAWLADALRTVNCMLERKHKRLLEKERALQEAVETLRLTRSYARSLNEDSGLAAITTIAHLTIVMGISACFIIISVRLSRWKYLLKETLAISHTGISLFCFLSNYTNLEYQWFETLSTLEKSLMKMRQNGEISTDLNLWERKVELLNALPVHFKYQLWFNFNNRLIAVESRVVRLLHTMLGAKSRSPPSMNTRNLRGVTMALPFHGLE
ncbi:hypothetical protein EVAR_42729_1 [Eumeta japonica]|uniref:Uncharacterized protein n=1 Tax=Eumeta variegata TaxID=151549 RepID=A0A4C1XK82_EUMVA|nr:hypothetical protein EVAR_42729_1 [Eumeta japonica]